MLSHAGIFHLAAIHDPGVYSLVTLEQDIVIYKVHTKEKPNQVTIFLKRAS